MARDITSGFQTEIEASQLRPILLLKAEFDSGNVFMFTGVGTISWGGDDYLGGGNLLSIESIEETNELKAASTRFKVSGVPSSSLSLALSEDYQGRPISCYFGVLNSSGAIIADPYLVFKGKMDIMEITDSGETSEIIISAENDLIDLRVSRPRYYTPEDQKIDYPSDKGFNFVPNIQDITISWGVGISS